MEQNNQQMQVQDEQQKKNRKVGFIILGIAVLVIGIVGVTYSFFNYTRTGAPNTIETGRIYFHTDEGDSVTLNGLFPIDTEANPTITSETPGVGVLEVNVKGDTTYEEGVEYLVKAVNVTGANGIELPISIQIGYEANEGSNKTIGDAETNYFTSRGGNTSMYKVLSNDTISEGKDLVVGYIAPGATGIDGKITIMAYLDASNIAITDTNPERTVRTVNTTFTQAACEAATGLTGGVCASATALQEDLNNTTPTLTSNQIAALVSAGLVTEYTDGTTDNWVHGRTVFTTEEWNQLSQSGVSFQIRVEANEGIWVAGTIAGVGTVTPIDANSANITVTQGDVRYTTTATISEGPVLSFTDGVLEKYNQTTSSYDTITNSRDYNKVDVTLQNANCNDGNPVTVTNNSTGNYKDGMSTLDPAFVQCLITNNQ